MSVDLYTNFFGFSERPFTLLPDPDFLFWSPAHLKALTVLEYGLAIRSPLTVITGEVGTGKTTLIQHLLSLLDDTVTVGLISNAQGSRGDLLRWALYALSIPIEQGDDYVSMFHKFTDFVVAEYAAGRYVALVIDEAQNLSLEALEELRLLTNINANKDELLQLILVGQPELRDNIRHPSLTQFVQRISATFHLKSLTEQQTGHYIRHRLRHVGGSGDEFTPNATVLIYKESQGIPRLVNKFCDLCLVYAAADDQRHVDAQIAQEVLNDDVFVHSSHTVATTGVLVLENPIFHSESKAAE